MVSRKYYDNLKFLWNILPLENTYYNLNLVLKVNFIFDISFKFSNSLKFNSVIFKLLYHMIIAQHVFNILNTLNKFY